MMMIERSFPFVARRCEMQMFLSGRTPGRPGREKFRRTNLLTVHLIRHIFLYKYIATSLYRDSPSNLAFLGWYMFLLLSILYGSIL